MAKGKEGLTGGVDNVGNRVLSGASSKIMDVSVHARDLLVKRYLIHEVSELSKLPPDQRPQHVVFIPDGDRRWAGEEGLSEEDGHRLGAQRLYEYLKIFGNLDIPNVTIWGLSRKNRKKRSSEELENICKITTESLEMVLPDLMKSGGRFIHIGNKERLSPEMLEIINKAEEMTKGNNKHTLRLAFDYDETTEDKRLIEDVVSRIDKGEDMHNVSEDKVREMRLESLSIFAGEKLVDYEDKEEREKKLQELEELLEKTLVIRTGDGEDDGLPHSSGFGALISHSSNHTIAKYLPATSPFDIIKGFKKYARTHRRSGR